MKTLCLPEQHKHIAEQVLRSIATEFDVNEVWTNKDNNVVVYLFESERDYNIFLHAFRKKCEKFHFTYNNEPILRRDFEKATNNVNWYEELNNEGTFSYGYYSVHDCGIFDYSLLYI